MNTVMAARAENNALDQRVHPRISLRVQGRYMLVTGEEFPCETLDVSPWGLSIRVIKNGRPGDRVLVYLSELGRIEGRIVRRYPDRLAIAIVASPFRRERIAERIEWLLKHRAGLARDRRATVRDENVASQMILRMDDGREFPAELVELSLSGARIKVAVKPPVSARVWLGQKSAVVERSADESVALSFS